MAEHSLSYSKSTKREVHNDKVFESWSSTQIKVLKIKHTWTINNFSLCSKKTGESLKSPTFSAGINNEKSQWSLELYPKGKNNPSNLALYLNLDTCEMNEIQANCTFYIMNTEDDIIIIQRNFSRRFTKQTRNGYSNIVALEYLFDKENKALMDDKLTIVCEIDIPSSENNLETHSTPQSDLDKFDFTFLHESKEFSDITLSAGGKEFPAHKAILAARSPVFRTMFQQGMEESRNNRVEITDIDDEVLCEMLRYMYTGKINKLEEVASTLICAAEKYSMDGLKIKCEKVLVKSLTLENVAELFILSNMFFATELKNQVKQFIAAHAFVVGQLPEFQVIVLKYPHLVSEVFGAITDNYLSIV